MTGHDGLRAQVEDAILHHYYYATVPAKDALSLLDELQNMHDYLDSETKYHHADLLEAAEIERERNEWKKRVERAEVEKILLRLALQNAVDSMRMAGGYCKSSLLSYAIQIGERTLSDDRHRSEESLDSSKKTV